MAPLRMEGDRSMRLNAFSTTLGFAAALILLIIMCGCVKKKKRVSGKQEQEKTAANSTSDHVPKAKIGSGKQGRKSKSPSSKLEKKSKKDQSVKEKTKAPPPKQAKQATSMKPPSSTPKFFVAANQIAVMKTQKPFRKVIQKRTSIVSKPPSPVSVPKGPATTPTTPEVPNGVKFPQVMESPAPTPSAPLTSTPAPQEKDSGVEFIECPADFGSSTITPRGGPSPAPRSIVKPKVPKSDHVRHNDPAYRSLTGLDDVFDGEPEVGADAVMPTFTARSVSNLPSQTAAVSALVSSDHGKKKGRKKKGLKSKSSKKG